MIFMSKAEPSGQQSLISGNDRLKRVLKGICMRGLWVSTRAEVNPKPPRTIWLMARKFAGEIPWLLETGVFDFIGERPIVELNLAQLVEMLSILEAGTYKLELARCPISSVRAVARDKFIVTLYYGKQCERLQTFESAAGDRLRDQRDHRPPHWLNLFVQLLVWRGSLAAVDSITPSSRAHM